MHPTPNPAPLGRYPTGRGLALAEDGVRPAAIARNLGVDAERVRLDVARASGRPIPIFGSGPLPASGRSCNRGDVVRLAREEGLGATQMAARLGYSRSTVDCHLLVARRRGELPLAAPGGFANAGNAGSAGANKAATPMEGAPLAGEPPWSGAEGLPPSDDVADQVLGLGQDSGLPVHEVFRLVWLGARQTQIARALGLPTGRVANLVFRARRTGLPIPVLGQGRYNAVRLPTDPPGTTRF